MSRYSSSHTFRYVVRDGVYPPSEDTWLTVKAIELLPNNLNVAVDLGCGSGVTTLYLSTKARYVIAIDIMREACENTLENARANNVSLLDVVNASLLHALRDESVDAIVFNAPYLPCEEWEILDKRAVAWCGGRDGRLWIDAVVPEAKRVLKRGGYFILTQSTLSDEDKTVQSLISNGFRILKVLREYVGFFEEILSFITLKMM